MFSDFIRSHGRIDLKISVPAGKLDFNLIFLFLWAEHHSVTIIESQEQHLLEQLKAGNQQALKTIFLQYHEELCHAAYRIVGDVDKSKDIVQDVFLKVWLKRESIQISGSLRAYLKRAVVNLAINAYHQQKTLVHDDLETIDEPAFIDLSLGQEYRELANLAQHAIDKLPGRTKAVFHLIRMEGMSYKEVSDALQISEKAVEKEMMKALRLLRISLKDYLVALIFLKIFL